MILVKKAERLRKETGDSRYHAPLEKEESKPWVEQANHILAKPFKVLVQEPMLIALTIYMSVRLTHQAHTKHTSHWLIHSSYMAVFISSLKPILSSSVSGTTSQQVSALSKNRKTF